MSPAKPLAILLIEDSPSDVYLTTDAIENSGVDCRVDVVQGREQALSYVRGLNGNGQSDHDVVLFGLNPFKNESREILAEYRLQFQSTSVPLIVLGASPVEKEILKSSAIEADGLLLKPIGADDFRSFITEVSQRAKTSWKV